MKQNIIVLGAGSLAKDIADLVEEIPDFKVVGFLVNKPPYVQCTKLAGKPIFWIDELESFDKSHKIINGIARMEKVRFISQVKNFGYEFLRFIHPSSNISQTVILGEGSTINRGVHIATCANLGNFVYINRGSLIGHDTIINDYSVVSPGVNIAGNVVIGSRTYIGMGSIIIERVKIGNGCFIGAGSLVTMNVPDHVKVVGAPARIIEKDIEEF